MMTRHDMRQRIDRALTVRLATISRNGTPLLTPLWFGRDGDLVYIGTRSRSPHVRNILSHPRVVMLFSDDRGRETQAVLRVAGIGRVLEYRDMSLLRQLRMFWRYSLRRETMARVARDVGRLRLRRQYREERNAVMVEVTLQEAELLNQPDWPPGGQMAPQPTNRVSSSHHGS